MLKNKNVLILAPHTDDGELGLGGTISRLVRNECSVYYLAFSAAEESVPQGLPLDILRTEVLDATSELGIKSTDVEVCYFPVRRFSEHRQNILDKLIEIRSKRDFDIIFCPSSTDVHQDHQVIHNEAIRAFKNKNILGYNCGWNQNEVHQTCYVNIEEIDLFNKVNSLRHYNSQFGRGYMSEEYVRSQARVLGVHSASATGYSEAFQVIRINFG